MAKFLIIRGQENSGKTTTSGLVYSELLKFSETKHTFDNETVESNSLKYDKKSGDLLDFSSIITINGKSIGIVSAGDSPTDLEKEINSLININIDVIICCARSRNVEGSSFRMIINKFSAKNEILKEVWVEHSEEKKDKETKKKQSVSEIVKIIMDFVKIG